MEITSVGALSVLPPIIAIVLALITKEVLFSLITGVLSGSLIYCIAAGLNPAVGTLEVTFDVMVDSMDLNIVIFGFFLGALVFLVGASGGAEAYGRWVSKLIHSERSSLLFTALLGCLIFLDDYFNCLTVGTIMKPITDRNHVSRAKLAFIIDATAAPICIIAPISTWAAAVGSYLKGTGAFGSEFMAFVSSIPYNFYAILTLIMVFIMAAFSLDYGPMARAEKKAKEGDVGAIPEPEAAHSEEATGKGTVADMLIPVIVLIVISIFGMLYTGGYWSGDPAYHSFVAALGNSTPAQAMVWGSFVGIVVALIMYVPRKIMSFSDFMENVVNGMKMMITSICILVLAWTIGSICRDLLDTPGFMKAFVETTGLPGFLLPALVFVLAILLSASTGTSWGTFGILIPIVIPVAEAVCPELLMASLGATLAGSVCGDHCSPISDTTILSSCGAGVEHLTHVGTQVYYAITVAVVCLVGYIIIGLTGGNVVVSLIASVILLIAVVIVLHQYSETKLAKEDMAKEEKAE